MRLRGRLLLLIGAALLPAFAVQLDFEREAREARGLARKDEVTRLARLVAADIESLMEGARQTLAAVARFEEIRSGDVEACVAKLQGLRQDSPRYANLKVTDAEGRIVCSANRAVIGRNVAHRSYVRHAQETGRFAAGEHGTNITGGPDLLHLGLPLDPLRHGQDGAVVLALDLDWLAERLALTPWPQGSSVVIADRAGTVLARWPDPARFVGLPAVPQFLDAARGAGFTLSNHAGLDGVRRLYAVGPVGEEPQRLLVGVGIDPRPSEAALAVANRHSLLMILGGGLAALLAGFFVARRFMERPVEALVAAMERWRAGDAGARATADPRLGDVGDRNEFHRIALSFDEAAATVQAREASLRESEAALRESEALFRHIGEALEDGLAIAEPEQGRILYTSPSLLRLFGLPAAHPPQDPAEFLAHVHPEDRATLRDLFARPAHLPYDIEYRVPQPDGGERRLRHRRFPVPGSATGRVVGVLTDVTAEREAADRQSLLAREVDHRAKNVLTVVQSTLRLTRADSPRAFAAAVEGRVAALARAHQLLARGRWSGSELTELLAEEFAPYTQGATRAGRQRPRCVLDGPPLRLRAEAVQPLAMAMHELATNAAKYGALSGPGGTIRISWAVLACGAAGTPALAMRWQENGGPLVAGAPAQEGFGSRVIVTTIVRQLGGIVRFDWAPSGLICSLEIPAAKALPSASMADATLAADLHWAEAGAMAASLPATR